MFDKLLARIAGRNTAETEPVPLSVIAGGEHGRGHSSLISSAGAMDPFGTSYPASNRVRSARTGLVQSSASNAWQTACDAYTAYRVNGGRIADQPAFFAGWGAAHMAVAQMLWAEHDRLHWGQATLSSGPALLAVLQAQTRTVMINEGAYAEAAPLSLHQAQPQLQTKLGTPVNGKGFVSYPLHALLWFYGQVYTNAPDLLPPEMGTHLIQLRRFPPVTPAALEMRHLALIHVFSGGALSFAQLQRLTPTDKASNLCADLSSLHFTGALRLLPA